jgi:1-deoxy-D-xylulose-5-phosphate reductoisomerase
LAYAAGRAGGTMPAVLNGANEQAVALFLDEKIPFLAIPQLIEQVCDRHSADNNQKPALADIIAMDVWARQAVLEASQKLSLATV